MSRIMFLGDLAATGFGTVTTDLGRALLDRGEDVRFWSLNEDPGTLPEPFESRTLRIGHPDGWLSAKARIEGLFVGGAFDDGWTPDAAIVLGDVGSLEMSPLVGLIPAGFPVFHYVPIEGVGLPPAWGAFWRVLHPVAMSEFGAEQIAPIIGQRPPVVYHGVNTDDFWPVSADRPIVLRGRDELRVLRTKADCKRFVGLDPDRVALLRTDRFMPRKNYPSLLRALAPVLARQPTCDLVLHCLESDQGGRLRNEFSKYPGLSIPRTVLPNRASRRAAQPAVLLPQMRITGLAGRADRRVLNALYNAADIYVSVSAEGFGLTIAEAMAAGVPAVAMDYSSVPEVVGDAGILIPPAGLIDNIYSFFWAVVREDLFGEAVERLVQDPFLRQRLGSLGPPRIRERFRWDTAAEQFAGLVAAAVPRPVEVAV